MHKLYAPVMYDGKPYIAKVTVEEYGVKETGRRFYNLRAIKISPAGGALDLQKSYDTVPYTEDNFTVADLFELVKKYDKDFSPVSVNRNMLNKDGTPKLMYHGTRRLWRNHKVQTWKKRISRPRHLFDSIGTNCTVLC